MLIRPSDLEQFGQRVGKKPIWPRFGWFKGFYETNESTQNKLQTTPNETRLSPNRTPRSKRDKTKV
jgi:hypothetical protein